MSAIEQSNEVNVAPILQSIVPGIQSAPANPPLWKAIYKEKTQNDLTFNVMPEKPVKETLLIQEYRIADRYAEADFDREYQSSMEKSPSHLIFLSALVHTQKLTYALLCHDFGFNYDPQGREVMKLWPYDFEIKLPRLIRQEKGLTQKLWLKELTWKNDKEFRFTVDSKIGSGAIFTIKAVGYLA